MNYTLNIKKNNKNSLCILLNGKKYEVNSQWLYEHSDNAEIRDPYTKQLLIEAAEISPSLKIIDAQIEKETLAITFSDNSQHNYKINYIYSQLKKAPVSDDKYLWNKKNLKVPKYNFKNINNKMLFDIMSSVDKLGFCLVRNIPKKKNGLNELMKLIGPVKKTNWGGIADVKNINKAYDLTMTTRGLENHTDNPYRFPTQGYIFLHCIENANNGGENTITEVLILLIFSERGIKNTLIPLHHLILFLDTLIKMLILKINVNLLNWTMIIIFVKYDITIELKLCLMKIIKD